LNPLEMQCLKDEGRCFHCKQTGHTSRRCPKKQEGECSSCSADSSKETDDKDSKTVVGESTQTWKPNGHGNVHVTRQGEDGQQVWAKYIHFETVGSEPMVYGIMDEDEAIYEEPLRAAPCYDTFPFPAPTEGSYHAFLNVHDFDRTAIKEVEALEDHGILAELYRYKRYELEETSIRHEEVQERLALDMKERWRLLQRKLLEAKKREVIQKLKEAKVQGRLLERRYAQQASKEQINGELELIGSSQKKEIRSIAIQTLEVRTCLYCGEASHESIICSQPHFRCTKLGGCHVKDTHQWFYPQTRCLASPSHPSELKDKKYRAWTKHVETEESTDLCHDETRDPKRQKRTRNDEEGGQALEVLMCRGQALEDLMRPWIATHVEERSSSTRYSQKERESRPKVSRPRYQIIRQQGPL